MTSADSEQFRRDLNESARLLSQHRPGEAAEILQPLYEAAPDHPDIVINLSGAYILQRKWRKAVEILKQAVKRHPDNAMLWTNLGAAELGQLELAGPKQQEKAIAAYQNALRADPEAPNVHYHLGLIYKDRGEHTRAGAFFQRALEVNPRDRDARHWLDWLSRRMVEELQQRQEQNSEDSQRQDLKHQEGGASPTKPPTHKDDGEPS
jgi:tetratricopeptide (TPR) repeat protein